MPTLEVHKLDGSEIYLDIIRVNTLVRKSRRGRRIPEGLVAIIRVDGRKKGYAILRGYAEDVSGHIRMDEVTRARLGNHGKPYLFEFEKAGSIGQLRWASNASEVAYRFAIKIAVISLILGMAGIALGGLSLIKDRTPNKYVSRIVPAGTKSLTVDEVIEWRHSYADLIGKTQDAAIERYGPPSADEHPAWLVFPLSDKTGGRTLNFGVKDENIYIVKVFRKSGDSLDAIEVSKKTPLFDFTSGTYTDTTKNYLTGTTKDQRSTLQFSVSEKGVYFEAAAFPRGEL
jgi:hypothetical protein